MFSIWNKKILSFIVTGLYALTFILIVFVYPIVKRNTKNENVLAWFRVITIALPIIGIILTIAVLILNMVMPV